MELVRLKRAWDDIHIILYFLSNSLYNNYMHVKIFKRFLSHHTTAIKVSSDGRLLPLLRWTPAPPTQPIFLSHSGRTSQQDSISLIA